MTTTGTRASQREPGIRRKSWAVLTALAVFATLAALPAILPALHLKITSAPPTASDGIKLLGAPQALPPIPLPPAARPTNPGQPTAAPPRVSETPVGTSAAARPGSAWPEDHAAWPDGARPDRGEMVGLGLVDGPVHFDRRLARLRLEDTRLHGRGAGSRRPASRPGHGPSRDWTGPLPRLDY